MSSDIANVNKWRGWSTLTTDSAIVELLTLALRVIDFDVTAAYLQTMTSLPDGDLVLCAFLRISHRGPSIMGFFY